jgi:lipopolysaccharide/colanic/teichoic acid biosynthesis glycosyltransferase
VVSCALLLLTSPFWVTAAILVRITSPGSAFFRQVRVGRSGRHFVLYKLRTMTDNAAGPGITTGSDKRVTRLGRVLRRLKIDELPQLWNVAKGDMSLVGPRPEIPDYVRLADPLWCEVLEVRPGLTDPITIELQDEESLLAQVQGDPEGYYRSVLQPYKLRGYAAYLRRRSWVTDVCVLGKTLLAIAFLTKNRRELRIH